MLAAPIGLYLEPTWVCQESVCGTDRPRTFLTNRSWKPGSRGSVETGPFVTEVHPAVAIWQWCADQRPRDADWNYKKSRDTQEAIIDVVLSRWAGTVPRPTNDDELDALVAWMLGVRWVTGSNDVTLLGNAKAGSFLLPHTDELAHAFDAFLADEST